MLKKYLIDKAINRNNMIAINTIGLTMNVIFLTDYQLGILETAIRLGRR